MSYFADNSYKSTVLLPGAAESVQDYIDSDTIRIVSATRERGKDHVTVSIETSRFLLDDEIRFITDDISEKLRPLETNCVFDYTNAIDEIKQNERRRSEAFIDLWCAYSPQLEPILRRCSVEMRGGECIIHCPPRFVLALTESTAGAFRAHLDKLYSWTTAISILADSSLADGMDDAEPVVSSDWGVGRSVVKSRRPQRKAIQHLSPADIIYGKEILKPELVRMADLTDRSGRITVKGTLLDMEVFVSEKRKTTVLTLSVTDRSNTVFVKLFPDELTKTRTIQLLEKAQKEPCVLMIRGSYRY
ncbi:MAG: hypothetical protein II072_05855, partial [Clostridia bacterium]|nr:hypothetical protein [Clostridia bacterium]